MDARLDKFVEARELDSSTENRSTMNSTTKEELDYDEMDMEESTTSKYNGLVLYEEEQDDTSAESAGAESRPKSIMKTSEHPKHQYAVRFLEIPDVLEEPEEQDEKPTCLEKWRIFCSKPVCKVIKTIVFYIILPCSSIYVAIFFLSKLKVKLKPIHKGKPFT